MLLIISDRGVDENNAPIPALLALGAVHQHLIRLGLRTSVSLIVESGEPREVHHLACLVGMGAEAVNPYLALATIRNLAVERDEIKGKGQEQEPARTPAELADEAEHNYIHGLEKGLLKIMSKIGIATVDSYCGAQIFEAIGLDDKVVERCFTGVPARLGGVDYVQAGRRCAGAPRCGLRQPAAAGGQSHLALAPWLLQVQEGWRVSCLLARRRPRASKGGQWRRLRGLPRL